MPDRPRVLVAMSGGVDSSVAACLLVEQGYDVVGVFMRVGHTEAAGEGTHDSPRHRGCCSAADAGDACRVAGQLGIPFYSLNFEAEFSRLIDYFADEYAAARTPNPCVMCNQWLKFGRLLAYAEVVGAELIATGHYARLDASMGRPRLSRAADHRKDQSYVLFAIPEAARGRTMFPLGELSKNQVRDEARRFGLAVHDKPDSQDICFVPDGDYARVVRARRPNAFRPGEIRHTDGRLLARHDGMPSFTVGQRRGLRIAMGRPVYVTELDSTTDTVTVGWREDTLRTELEASRTNWWIDRPTNPIRAEVRIRSNHIPAAAVVSQLNEDRVRVEFDEPQSAITPGQAVVFYDSDHVLGGGWID